MTSAELARVTEVTALRVFRVENDGDEAPRVVVYNTTTGELRCKWHQASECTHIARVRLSGVLTNSVVGTI